MERFPNTRMRRLRQTAALRDLQGTDFPRPSRLIWPVFVVDGHGIKEPIESLPGQHYFSVDMLPSAIEPVINTGVKSILLFGQVDKDKKSETGEYACRDDGLVQCGLRLLRKEFPELSLFADTGLSGYTIHGHAGVIGRSDEIDNDATLDILRRVAVSQAEAGATCIAPSAMMDGQVRALRSALDEKAHHHVLVMSYSCKFHSNLYDSFPYAVAAPRKADPRTQTYLAPPHDSVQAIREAQMDEEEGADIVMIKPALFYLDIVSRIRDSVSVPVATYSVSGEYSLIQAAAKAGFSDKYKLAREAMLAMRRSGADIIISYWANFYPQLVEAEY